MKNFSDEGWEIDSIPMWHLKQPGDTDYHHILAYHEDEIRVAGLGLLGNSFITTLINTLNHIQCKPSCVSAGTACSCGAEDCIKEVQDLLQRAESWVGERPDWDAIRQDQQNHRANLSNAGRYETICVDPEIAKIMDLSGSYTTQEEDLVFDIP